MKATIKLKIRGRDRRGEYNKREHEIIAEAAKKLKLTRRDFLGEHGEVLQTPDYLTYISLCEGIKISLRAWRSSNGPYITVTYYERRQPDDRRKN